MNSICSISPIVPQWWSSSLPPSPHTHTQIYQDEHLYLSGSLHPHIRLLHSPHQEEKGTSSDGRLETKLHDSPDITLNTNAIKPVVFVLCFSIRSACLIKYNKYTSILQNILILRCIKYWRMMMFHCEGADIIRKKEWKSLPCMHFVIFII